MAGAMADERAIYELRPAGPGDAEFLYRLNELALREAVEQTYGRWDEPWQRWHFRDRFDPAATRIVVAAGRDVGALKVLEHDDHLFLATIELHPDWQQRGIGSAILRDVLADAARKGKPVALQVFKVNAPARRLYERLGFVVTGETETHFHMRHE
jgi:ribosomal protein S18 acetylase RimI-like enzyme